MYNQYFHMTKTLLDNIKGRELQPRLLVYKTGRHNEPFVCLFFLFFWSDLRFCILEAFEGQAEA